MHLILMENTVMLKDSSKLTHVFDLKGSLVNRQVTQTKPSTTLKDQNFIDLQLPIDFMDQKQYLLYTVRNDVEFLKQLGIMDYSLLLVIEEKGEQTH